MGRGCEKREEKARCGAMGEKRERLELKRRWEIEGTQRVGVDP